MTKGERIKARRESLGISQTALADMIGESKQTMYKYENNITTNLRRVTTEKTAQIGQKWLACAVFRSFMFTRVVPCLPI